MTTSHAGGVNRFEVSPGETANNVIDPLGTRYYTSLSTVLGAPRIASRQRCDSTNANCSQLFTITYGLDGNVQSYTNELGVQTKFFYLAGRNLESSRAEAVGTAAARSVVTTWHTSWPLPTEIKEYSGGTDSSGAPLGVLKRRTVFTYDGTGNLLQRDEIDSGAVPTTRSWIWTYGTFGRVLTEEDPTGKTTTYAYHSDSDSSIGRRGNLSSITDAAGNVTQFTTYDDDGRLLTSVDSNGRSTTFTYDSRGRVTSETATSGSVSRTTQYAYWPDGMLKRVTQPDGGFVDYSYDSANRLTGVLDSLGNSVTYTLDNAGNRTGESARDPGNVLRRQITRTYDFRGRLQSVTGAMQ